MLDFSLFRNGTFSGSNAVSALSFFALFGVFFFISIYLQTILGRSTPLPGRCCFTVLLALRVPDAGSSPTASAHRWRMTAGMLVLGVSLLILSRLGLDSTFADLLAGLLLGGARME